MSQVKLTLRPPPNVDFVHGYPGIPPGNDRPQAAVKGAIEVRTPPAGVKAKFVRIELRKVETLPGGGPNNTFFDYVGPSPVNLWTSSDDYSILRAQDFQFSIRIPESIPPSIALDNKAGIHYELVATVCTKGKRGFLRRRKSVVVTEIAQVIIDKHELHSTWPVYCQPETRQVTMDGMTLIAERNHTCYGPGDRIAVVATLKSDIVHTVVLRGFEMILKETSIFRGSPFGSTRKGAPEVRVLHVSETKTAIHATLYGGATHKAELSCILPPNHTTTTLNAARHIDVAYVLSVKAMLSTGTNITIDLPVMISNWQRHVSQEAIRRVGPVASLSLQTAPSSNPPVATPIMGVQQSNNLNPKPIISSTPASPVPAISTLPTSPHGKGMNQFQSLPASNISKPINNSTADEFGYGAGYKNANPRRKSTSRESHDDTVNSRPPATVAGVGSASTPIPRPGGRINSTMTANRFTIMNAEPDYIDDSPTAITPSASASNTARTAAVQSQTSPKLWPTAEEEKRAYEMARAKVAEVQGVTAAPPPVSSSPSSYVQNKTTTSTSSGRKTSLSNKPWLSAEEEKVLLYEKAQAAVLRAQRGGTTAEPQQHASASGSSSRPAASEIYQQAMSNINATANKSSPTYTSALSGSSLSRKQQSPGSPVPVYLTAEQEKAALRRYEEAKKAVDRVHNNPNYVDAAAPIAYDSLYPAASGSGSHAPVDAPPSFEASVSAAATAAPMSALAEKERLRKAYETQDTVDKSQQSSPPPAFSPSTPTAPPPSFDVSVAIPPSTAQQYKDAAVEKEALRKKFERRDAAAKKQTPRSAATPMVSPLSPSSRPIPPTPTKSNTKVLTAAEEKALVKAKREAKDAKAQKKPNGTALNGHTTERHENDVAESNEISSMSNLAMQRQATPPPPPLMPRPPVEYIQETQEEDARVSKFAIDGASVKLEEGEDEYSHGALSVNGHVLKAPGPPPPLPPKPAVE